MLSENLKQRIVGGFVLLALALILFALLFDFSDDAQVDTRSQIPDSPEIAPVVVAEPVRPDNIEDATDAESIFQPEISEEAEDTTSSVSEPPKLTDDGVAEAWVLQVGSFRDRAKAQLLVEQLLAEGYSAYVREQKDDAGVLSRVFVGPKVLKSKLLEEKAAIDKKYGVNALMLRFDP